MDIEHIASSHESVINTYHIEMELDIITTDITICIGIT